MGNRSSSVSNIGRIQNWAQSRKEILKFFLIFVVLLSAFSFILEQDSVQRAFVLPHLNQVAWMSGTVLNTSGMACSVYESSVSSSRFSIQIVRGCESIYPTAMLWAAVIAFPLQARRAITWKWKLIGVVGGAVVLAILNIIRVVTMFYIGAFFPSFFDMVHIYAWQALFILITLAVFLFWAAKASKATIAL